MRIRRILLEETDRGLERDNGAERPLPSVELLPYEISDLDHPGKSFLIWRLQPLSHGLEQIQSRVIIVRPEMSLNRYYKLFLILSM